MKGMRLQKEEAAAKRASKKAAKAEAEAAKTVETEEQTVEDDGSGVGLQLIGEEAHVETVTQQVLTEVVDTVVDENTTSVTTKQEFHAARTELKKVVDTDTTPVSEPDLEEDLEEDESGDGETIFFEGIEYTLDTEENIVYDDELAEIGKWDGETIEFDNATAAKLHRVRKLALKND
tara:strand:- start:331 stop:861 length:531 start_codon:yes stop_codon:yes gene_type:complete